jgi:putative intracellular protease/amidase
LEDKLKELGANYTSKGNWESYTQEDGLLITGQNPASSEGVAKLLLKTLKKKNPVHS